jgi:hypothetical protein
LKIELFATRGYVYARWIVICLQISLPFTRLVSGFNLIAITLLAWMFLFFHWKRKLIPVSLIYFTIIVNGYFVLSFFNVFPTIWTVRFELNSIPQQAFFYYSLLPMFYIFFVCILSFLDTKKNAKRLMGVSFLLFIYSKIVYSVLNGFDPQIFFSIAGLGNQSALAVLGFVLAISLAETSKIKGVLIVIMLLMSFYSPYSQNKVFALIFIGLYLIPRYSYYAIVGFVSTTVIFYSVFIFDPMSVRFLDENLSVRLVLIRDAIDGFIDSNFIGVGFGTESIKNYYFLFKNPQFFDPDDSGFMHLSVHNSFATMAYRVGIVSFLVFLTFLYDILISIKNAGNNRADMAVLFLCFYIVSFQNPALESFGYMIGAFMMLGSIWALGLVEKLK